MVDAPRVISRVRFAPLRVGVIGTGHVGRAVHLPALNGLPGVTVVAVCDPDDAALARAGALAPGARRFTDHRDLLAHGVDAVTVCTPNVSHFAIARDALRAGAHVLVEKPLCVAPEEVRALGAEASARGRVLMTRHQLRFDPEAVAARARVATLGPLRRIDARALRRDRIPTTPGLTDAALAGGGAVLDLGAHALDMALWLAGFPPVASARVTARAEARYGRGEVAGYRNHWGDWEPARFNVEDSATADIRFPDGLRLSLQCAWAGEFAPADTGTSCGIIGDAGTVRWGAPAIAPRHPSSPPDFAAFVNACLQGGPSPVPWTETLATIELIDAVYRAVREGREVEVGDQK